MHPVDTTQTQAPLAMPLAIFHLLESPKLKNHHLICHPLDLVYQPSQTMWVPITVQTYPWLLSRLVHLVLHTVHAKDIVQYQTSLRTGRATVRLIDTVRVHTLHLGKTVLVLVSYSMTDHATTTQTFTLAHMLTQFMDDLLLISRVDTAQQRQLSRSSILFDDPKVNTV
jgi:hypothetical protein